MRVLLDEDVPVQVLEALQQVLHGHTIDHVNRIGWKSKKDLALLTDAGKRGYEVLVTNDKNQLEDVEESRAIRDSGMHHVRYDQDTTRPPSRIRCPAKLGSDRDSYPEAPPPPVNGSPVRTSSVRGFRAFRPGESRVWGA